MRYQAVRWIHDFDDEPVMLFSEVDPRGAECRKVEEYRDGRLDVAGQGFENGSTQLAQSLMPSLDEINMASEFVARSIDKRAFEAVWLRAGRRP